jgi:hypothetical protein
MVDVRTNLLKNRQTLSEKDYQRERNLLRTAVVSLIVVVILAISLSVWNFVMVQKLAGINDGIANSTSQMKNLTMASAQQTYLKSRLKLVTGFLSGRSVARESLQKIFSTTITGAHVSAVTFENDTTLGVQYTSSSVSSLNEVLSYYSTDTLYFPQVISRGLFRQKDGTYQLSLALTMPKGAD